MYGIKVDADAIARGLLDMVPDLGESYEGALAFGMLPAPLMDSLRKMLGDKFDTITAEQSQMANTLGELGLVEMAGDMHTEIQDKRKKWVAHVEREVSCAMYQHAEMVV